MGIIERLFYVWVGSWIVIGAGFVLFRLYGPPLFGVFPPRVNIGENRPQGLEFTITNFGGDELVNIEQNVNGQWVVITPSPIRVNAFGYEMYRTPAWVAPNQPGIIEYRAVGLGTGKIAYTKVTVVDPFP